MKVFAQSTLANGNPYIHLGYLSATTSKPQSDLLYGGIIALNLGVVLLVSAFIGKFAFGVARRRSTILLLGACALMVLGVAGLVLSFVYAKEILAHAETVTSMNGAHILAVMQERSDRGQNVPNDLSSLGMSKEALTDGWRNPFRLVITGEAEARTYSIISAGSDEKFDTADDLRFASVHP